MGDPTVTPLVESWHNAGFLVSEANGHLSRDEITLASGYNYLAATVLGKITTGTTATSAALGTNTGNGVFGDVTLVTVATQVGAYSMVFTDATHFTVTAPDGSSATGVAGSAFSALGMGFTFSAGSTPMAVGDSFAITVTGVVGKPTAAAVADSENTGDGTMSAVTTTGYAPKLGAYKVNFVEPASNLGSFVVEDPDGEIIGHGVVGTAFSGGGISFTIADGSTDFAAGDQFTVTVAAGSGYYQPWNPKNVNGSQVVAGILFGAKDATSAAKPGLLIARQAEVNASELIWPTGINSAQKTAGLSQLAALTIIAR